MPETEKQDPATVRISDRVEELAEGRHLIARPGDDAIDEVRDVHQTGRDERRDEVVEREESNRDIGQRHTRQRQHVR